MASRQPATTYEGETREPLQGPKAWVGPLILDEELRSERQPLRGLYKLTALLLLIGVATDALEKLFGVTSAVVTVQFFDIQGSQSLLTWFNSMLFLGAAALAAVIARDDPSTREFDTWSWWAICLGMLAASADEVIGAHELFLDYLRVQLHMVGVSHYVWLLPATMFLVGMSVWFIPFASRLPVSVGRRLILSAMIIGGGMIGMEMFGSVIEPAIGADHAMMTVVVAGAVQCFEMIGVVIALVTMAYYIDANDIRLRLSFMASNDPEADYRKPPTP
ncbi:hypothetical protein KDL45_10430 [bacterium]|nr:hypothetical protein [bacterium]